MDKREIMETIRENGLFTLFDITDKRPVEYKEKYGVSFDTILENHLFVYVKVNGGKSKCARICEENGTILFIYNGTQIRYNPEDIQTIEIGEFL